MLNKVMNICASFEVTRNGFTCGTTSITPNSSTHRVKVTNLSVRLHLHLKPARLLLDSNMASCDDSETIFIYVNFTRS